MPTQALLGDFSGSAYKLPNKVWDNYDWSIQHCVLRGDNSPIPMN
jgi:peptide-methionine (S)-S-oxide reductase